MTSDLVVIHTVNEQLDKAVFTGSQNDNPIMSSKLDNWHYNQVTGKVIEALFKDNEIYRNDVVGNGQTYYYLQDEETGEYQSFLVVVCADMTFHIKDRDVESIVYRSEPVFAIYPMDKIPATQEQTLPNFKWVGERRPENEEVFNRVIRPSMREQYEALQPPQFPLTDKINAYKSSLIKSGTWRDRDEDISQEAYDYIRRLESQKPLQ